MPDLTTIEQLGSALSEIGHEIRTLARWREKNESLYTLQRKPLYIPLDSAKDAADERSSSALKEKPNRLSQIVNSISFANMTLDSLPEPPAGAVSSAQEQETIGYNEHLLSEALAGLSTQLKNTIIKILEDPNVDQNIVSRLTDDLLVNRPTRQIRNTVQKIRAQYPEVMESGLTVRVALDRRREHESSARLGARALLVSAIVVVLLFGAWRFIYRPVSAHILYLNALAAIEDGRLDTAETLFQRARAEHRFRYQLLGVAHAYRTEQEFDRADRYFQRYIEEYPEDIAGLVSYGEFLAYQFGDEARARELTVGAFEDGSTDRELLRLLGDLHLERADRARGRVVGRRRGGGVAGYEDARYYYAYLLETHGVDRDSLANMLRIFTRTENQDEVATVTSLLTADDYQQIRPIILGEFIEYLLEEDRIEQAGDLLRDLQLSEVQHAGVHLQAARYFARIQNVFATEESLRNSEAIFRAHPPDTRYQEELFIRLQGRRAAMATENGDLERALLLYNRAIARFEQSLESGIVVPRRFFGALYAGRGDVHYASNNNNRALQDYEQARGQLYQSSAMEYAIGRIYYQRSDYSQAMQFFERVINAARTRVLSADEKNALYALGNASFLSGGYATALGYYRELITLLEREVDRTRLFIDEDDIPYREIIEMLIAVYNNAGVSYARLHQVQSDGGYLERSAVYLQRANEEYDEYLRESNVDLIAPPRSLSYRNSFAQSHDAAEELQIYAALPTTLTTEFIALIDRGVGAASTLADPRVRHTEFP